MVHLADTVLIVLPFCLFVLQGAYDASQHPGVISKRRTEEDVMEEFISTFEGEVKDGKVTIDGAIYVADVEEVLSPLLFFRAFFGRYR